MDNEKAKRNGNEPAFARDGGPGGYQPQSGMTKREVIAALVMAGLMSEGYVAILKHAEGAVLAADALLAELAKETK